MSGLLALLDDIAALTTLAAVQVDDVAGQAAKVGGKVVASVWDDAAKAGTKAAGVVIDDTAVTPKYVTGLPATRELPIVWQIAKGSIFNKIVILLPAAMLLSVFAPGAADPAHHRRLVPVLRGRREGAARAHASRGRARAQAAGARRRASGKDAHRLGREDRLHPQSPRSWSCRSPRSRRRAS